MQSYVILFNLIDLGTLVSVCRTTMATVAAKWKG